MILNGTFITEEMLLQIKMFTFPVYCFLSMAFAFLPFVYIIFIRILEVLLCHYILNYIRRAKERISESDFLEISIKY